MPHNRRSCTPCKKPNPIGCTTARLERRKRYDDLVASLSPQLPFITEGGQQAPEKRHPLEGMGLEQMDAEIQALQARKGKNRTPAVTPSALSARPALNLQFVGATS